MMLKRFFNFTIAAMLPMLCAASVTFNVQTPDGTKKCYIAGTFNSWDAGGALEMEPTGEANHFTLTVDNADASGLKYKYLCGQDWAYVEKDASGNEISDRTTPGNPDVVGSWASAPEWDIPSTELTVNGLPRLVKFYLPQDYATSGVSYPVIYYIGIQQRFNDAGSDTDRGDDFFGTMSWNAHASMEANVAAGGQAYIMVYVPTTLAECTIASNSHFVGTGQADAFLTDFENVVMAHVESNYRTNGTNVIVGADYSGILALYAAYTDAATFGTCVSMSPMLWVNRDEMLAAAATVAAGESRNQTYYVTYGTAEPAWMGSDVNALCEAMGSTAIVHNVAFTDASHEDESFGKSFANIIPCLAAGNVPPTQLAAPARSNILRRAIADFPSQSYTLWGGTDTNNLSEIGAMTYTDAFYKPGSTTATDAFIYTQALGTEYKSNYYWNVKNADGEYVLASNSKVTFKSSKSKDSWIQLALLSDQSLRKKDAKYDAFSMVNGDGTKTTMTSGSNYTASATGVKFNTDDKTFTIHYGSVNSGSDMGAITCTYSVGANCLEADVTYNYTTNAVNITETAWGQSFDDVSVTSFTAVPSSVAAGNPVTVTIALEGNCNVSIAGTCNFTNAVDVQPIAQGNGIYTFTFTPDTEGIYTFTASLERGGNTLDNVAQINVRAKAAGALKNRKLSVNAYDGVDWSDINRYKANFHTHTAQSFDCSVSTTEVVDSYNAAGYKILALTDHDANPYPWNLFSLYNSAAEDRDPEALGMLAVPGIELSKDRRNSWSEQTGGEFNHHNGLFTGRQGMEFMSLRESYAYTEALGGLTIINHPGQYWSLSKTYADGAKNSASWHAENFRLYNSLIGLEVYNQGNRRPNDRILWDQILSITMPSRPVWGYSCDDSHNTSQFFRNYEYMLMPELTREALQEAMKAGRLICSYEPAGSGNATAPTINAINIDTNNLTITIDSDDANRIEWISGTHKTDTSDASTRQSTIVGIGKTFNYSNFADSYVRARLVNDNGETAVQPFGFTDAGSSAAEEIMATATTMLSVTPNPASDIATISCTEPIIRVTLLNSAGATVFFGEFAPTNEVAIPVDGLASGIYIAVAATESAAYTAKVIVK
ncbi:MAG: alpha/beta hydrolase-fold protein [Bacteroidales bacterium]|nr:alpha/beta hydrolase-fold protein [Bacteroidales bacterium]